MSRKHLLTLFLGIWFPILAMAQDQEHLPIGRFQTDSVRIGEPIRYSLKFRHPSSMEVFFPDSTHNFGAFEYVDKEYYPTQTDTSGISLDSIVYELVTFDLDSVLELSVPAIIIKEGEADSLYPDKDGVFFRTMLAEGDTTLKENTEWADVEKEINYPYLLIGLGVLVVIAIIIFAVFGGKIKKSFIIKRLTKKHQKFIAEYEKIQNNKLDIQHIEKAVGIWKTYTGSLKEIPLQSYTTKEINSIIKNQKLNSSLQNLDRAVYAGIQDDNANTALDTLKNYTTSVYKQKIEKIKHG